jgi:hypothetical protein
MSLTLLQHLAGAKTMKVTLDADELMADALARARRTHFGDLSFVEPLHRLLRAYENEAELSRFGRTAARFDVMRCLTNLLRFDAAEEADPSIVQRQIARPLFITGLPRSSTTFLHTLLAHDPANTAPLSWQLIYPYPWRTRLFPRDLRRDWVELQFRIFRLLSPGVSRLHPLAADTPQECTDITAQVFQSLRFDTTHHIPSYQQWFERHGHRQAFRFHRRFLQHLDVQAPGRRWVLKSPDHVFALDAILEAYPDARIVFLHRDPLSVVASCAKLTELLRRPFTRRLDRREVGHQVASRLIESANRMAAESRIRNGRILHLHYKEVVSAPMDAVSAVYRHCGFELGESSRASMQHWLDQKRSHRTHRYDLAEFGLDPGWLRDSFARYMEVFSVPHEYSRKKAA